MDKDFVNFAVAVARVGESIKKFAVRCEEQEAFAVFVQPSYRV